MVKVEIRDSLYEEIRRYVSQSDEFDSIEDFVNFVLEEVLKEDEEEEPPAYSEEEEEQIKERLRGLGYL